MWYVSGLVIKLTQKRQCDNEAHETAYPMVAALVQEGIIRGINIKVLRLLINMLTLVIYIFVC